MADSLASTVARLERSESQNRRFVADVSHELRTPLTALVAEASIIEAGLADLPPDARRAGELLVADVRRLRAPRRRSHGAVPVRCPGGARGAAARRPRRDRPLDRREPAADGRASGAGRAGDRGGRRSPPRPDHRQPAGQRAVARAGRRRRGDGRARRRRRRPSRSPIAARAFRATRSRTCSTGSTRPMSRVTRAAPAWGSRSRRSTRRSSAAGLSPRTAPAAGSRSRCGCRLTNRYPRAMGRTWAESDVDDGSSAVPAPTKPARPTT